MFIVIGGVNLTVNTCNKTPNDTTWANCMYPYVDAQDATVLVCIVVALFMFVVH